MTHLGPKRRRIGAAPGGVAMKTRRDNTTKLKPRKGATAARSRSFSATDLQKQLNQRTRERSFPEISVSLLHVCRFRSHEAERELRQQQRAERQ